MTTDTVVNRLGIDAPAEYVGRLQLYQVFPWGRDDLAFEVVVPREFVPSAASGLMPRQPGEFQGICTFTSATPPQETLEVAVCRPFEVNLCDLAVRDVKTLGLTPWSIGTLDVGDRTLVECQNRTGRGDDAVAIRTFYYPNGSRVYRVSLTVAPEDLDTREREWDAALQTFRVIHASADPFREPMEVHKARGRVLLSFRYPKRWEVTEHKEAGDYSKVVDVVLPKRDGVLCRLRVKGTLREAVELSPEELVASALQELDGLGLSSFDDQPLDTERMQAPTPRFEPRAVYAKYRGQDQAGAMEIRLCALRSKRVGYVLTAMMPVEERDTYAWMLGKRAFEIVCRTLNRPDDIEPYDLTLEATPEEQAAEAARAESDLAAIDLAAIARPAAAPAGKKISAEVTAARLEQARKARMAAAAGALAEGPTRRGAQPVKPARKAVARKAVASRPASESARPEKTPEGELEKKLSRLEQARAARRKQREQENE